MSSRKIGGGRVLGNGRSLSPAVALQPKRNSSLLSPSTSTVSLNSSASTSHTSTEPQDLSSRVSLDQHDGAGAALGAISTSRLVCPICNEEMVTLLQLNRHLDDDHKNLEENKQDEVKDWFKTQMVKAKKFQPLAVLNQKLKGLDVFESNDPPSSPGLPPVTSPAPAKSPEPPRVDPDEVVTRVHWQKPTSNDVCSEPLCGKRLNSTNGKVNCRKCGKLFCEDHTMYQMKLSRSAQHEPVRGLWCRVCETCYKSREGYNDHNGLERDDTKDFIETRRRVVDKTFLEVSRLEKRLTRLTQLLAKPSEQNTSASSLLWPLSPMKNQRKELEQSIVTWEEDAKVLQCPFCQQEFSNYTFRRHHCRLCGRVVCGDPRTGCSKEVPLNVAAGICPLLPPPPPLFALFTDLAAVNGTTEKATADLGIDIRMCRDCQHTIFSSADFAASLAHKPPDVRAYENLVQFERGIRLLLPKFQRLLVALQDPDRPPSATQLADASKIRKRLMDSFTQYDLAARRIRDLPTASPTQRKLQAAIYAQASSFLHLHMLPLKTLPKVLKHASPHGLLPATNLPPTAARPASSAQLAAIKFPNGAPGSQASSGSALSALEEEERGLRERLIVLEEQRFMVGEMVEGAKRGRRFDEVASLQGNWRDLGREIDEVRGLVEGVSRGFEGVYAGEGVGGR
ncbi:carboxypeptidase Y-deficient [Xylographa carneopallida]|nr:carboxypeptidase Y-deficient [Xylographa carneopallida]